MWTDAFLCDVDAEVVDLIGKVVGEGDEVLCCGFEAGFLVGEGVGLLGCGEEGRGSGGWRGRIRGLIGRFCGLCGGIGGLVLGI